MTNGWGSVSEQGVERERGFAHMIKTPIIAFGMRVDHFGLIAYGSGHGLIPSGITVLPLLCTLLSSASEQAKVIDCFFIKIFFLHLYQPSR